MEPKWLVIVIGRMISLPFLILTFHYYWNSVKVRVLYKRCLQNYLVSLMANNIFVIYCIYEGYGNKIPTNLKHVYNVISMSTLLWTNVLCYDFWLRIKNFLPRDDIREEKKAYIKRFISVWLCTILYSTIYCINDYYILKSQNWLYWPIMYVLFGILCIVLLSNIFMMLHATVIIMRDLQSKITQSICSSSNNKKNQKKKQWLYFKLIAGTILQVSSNWYWYSLAVLLRKDHSTEKKPPSYTFFSIFLFVMVVNSYQGLFIFVVFTSSKKKLFAFFKKFSHLFNKRFNCDEMNTSEDKQSVEVKITNVTEN